MLFDQKANDEAYKYWRSTVLPRIKDPEKQRLLAPEVPPHPFGTKRNSLERRIYEVLDQPHIDIISVNETPVEEVTETGLRTKKGLDEVDVRKIPSPFPPPPLGFLSKLIHSLWGGGFVFGLSL